MKKLVLVSVLTLVFLASYAGAESAVGDDSHKDQNKKESISVSDHAKYCSKDMKGNYAVGDKAGKATEMKRSLLRNDRQFIQK